MIKVQFFCRRLPELTHDAYAKRLVEGHAPLALRHHQTMRAYVIDVIERSIPAGESYDSISSLSFESLDDYRERLCDSPEGARIIQADVEGFIGGADAFVTHERIHRDAAPVALRARSPGVKWILPLEPDEVEAWLSERVPALLAGGKGIRRLLTNVVDKRLTRGGSEWGGIAELSFERASDPDLELVTRCPIYQSAEYIQRRAG